MDDFESAIKAAKEIELELEKQLNELANKALEELMKAWRKRQMDDLISRQEAIDEIRTMQTYKLFAGDDMLLVDQAEAMKNLMMISTAEPSGELIRCKDCKKFKTKFCVMDIWHKDVTFFRANEDDYCSRSERRSDE